MQHIQKAFTLIELMIVVAIIGVLAAVAIPFYRDYIIRAEITEAYVILGSSRIKLRETYQEKGEWRFNPRPSGGGPPNPAMEGLPKTPTKYIYWIGGFVDEQKLILKVFLATSGISSELQGKAIVYGTPDGGVTWTCSKKSALFQKTSNILALTVESKYLPANCR